MAPLHTVRQTVLRLPLKLLWLLLLLLLLVVPGIAVAQADNNDIAELRKAIEALRAENRALAQRLATLEAGKSAKPNSPTASLSASPPTSPTEERIKALELGKTAQEDAVRSIIRDAVSSVGSKINNVVSLSGAIDVTAQRKRDFNGQRSTSIGLSTADLELDVQTNEWATASLKLEYTDGRDRPVRSSQGSLVAIDRLTVDTAFIQLGDAQRFPAQLKAGKWVLPFGVSTGRLLSDSLTLGSPLTVEVFEMRQNALGLSWSFPTPALRPRTPGVVVPPVQPLFVEPLLSSTARLLGYKPPAARPPPLQASQLDVEPPAWQVSLYSFDARTPGGLRKHGGAAIAYQNKGHCGKPYEELRGAGLCPWTASVDLSYTTSVFSSRFLEAEYAGFLDRIGRVPGLALSVKSTLGPVSIVSEWNGATRRATFTDDAGHAVSMRPSAWQISLGYQFGWNPWVTEIGAQGSFVALGYSQSQGLGGVQRALEEGLSTVNTRVGFVPKRRLLISAGEWLGEGLRLVVEVSREWDQDSNEGGSGKAATGFTTKLTYAF
jgi:uncharacterized coiled-coil protein SlyX